MMTVFPLISGDVAAGDVHEVEPLHVLIVLLRQQLGDVHSENIELYLIHIMNASSYFTDSLNKGLILYMCFYVLC